jgi:hypothetical protein
MPSPQPGATQAPPEQVVAQVSVLVHAVPVPLHVSTTFPLQRTASGVQIRLPHTPAVQSSPSAHGVVVSAEPAALQTVTLFVPDSQTDELGVQT